MCFLFEWICDFKIVCKKGMDISILFLVVLWIGLGINLELVKYYIIVVLYIDGFYLLDDGVIRFEFVFLGKIELYVELLKYKSIRLEFVDYVIIEKNGVNVFIIVELLCLGEFVL